MQILDARNVTTLDAALFSVHHAARATEKAINSQNVAHDYIRWAR